MYVTITTLLLSLHFPLTISRVRKENALKVIDLSI